MLFDVDRDVVDAYGRWSRSGEPQRLCDLVTASLMAGMAVTGSTRMQATSIQLLVMLTVLEMALRAQRRAPTTLVTRRPCPRPCATVWLSSIGA